MNSSKEGRQRQHRCDSASLYFTDQPAKSKDTGMLCSITGRKRGRFKNICCAFGQEQVLEESVHRARSSGSIRNCGTSSQTDADRGSAWSDKLDQSCLVRAECPHASHLHRGWSSIHFKSVEYAADGD